MRGDQNARDAAQNAGKHVGHHGHPQGVDAGVTGRPGVGAQEIDLIAKDGAVHDEGHAQSHRNKDEQHIGDGPDGAVGDVLEGIRHVVDGRAAGNGQGQAGVQLQAAEGDQHGGDGEGSDDEAVQGAADCAHHKGRGAAQHDGGIGAAHVGDDEGCRHAGQVHDAHQGQIIMPKESTPYSGNWKIMERRFEMVK